MENKNKKINASEIILCLISVIFLIGILTVFKTCGPKEDGSYMTCHWAGNAITGLAAVLTVIAVLHLFVKSQAKIGMDLAIIPTAFFTAILPKNVIGLCMMDNMQCQSLTRPATILFSILIIGIAILDLLLQKKISE